MKTVRCMQWVWVLAKWDPIKADCSGGCLWTGDQWPFLLTDCECHPLGSSHWGPVSSAAMFFSFRIPRRVLFGEEVILPFRSGVRMKSENWEYKFLISCSHISLLILWVRRRNLSRVVVGGVVVSHEWPQEANVSSRWHDPVLLGTPEELWLFISK